MKLKLNLFMFLLLYLLILAYYILQVIFLGQVNKTLNIFVYLLVTPLGAFIAASIIIMIIYISQSLLKDKKETARTKSNPPSLRDTPFSKGGIKK